METVSKILYTTLALLLLSVSCSEEKRTNRQRVKQEVHSNYDDLLEIKQRGVLRAIVDYNSINYFVYRGIPMGFQYEMLSKLADNLGVSLQVTVSDDMSKSFQLIENGKADLIAQNITIIKERKEFIRFSFPIISTRQVLVQRNDGVSKSPIIRDQNDLEGKEIWVQKQTSFYSRLASLDEEIDGDINIRSDSIFGVEQLIKMVSEGAIDYTVSDEMVGEVVKLAYENIDIETPISFPQQIAWALPKGANTFGDYVDAWIEKYKNTSSFKNLYNKYYSSSRYTNRSNSKYFSLNSDELSPYDKIIKKRSNEIGWDWRLMASLVYQESNFNPRARSWAGAMGLMQLMPATARRFGVRSPYSPEDNIRGGSEFLEWLDTYFKDKIPEQKERVNFVLASYNAGLGHVLDARRLAKKYGKDQNIWKNNVDYYLLNKSQSKYYRDDVVKWGYCRGQEPYNYVYHITSRYEHYKNVTDSSQVSLTGVDSIRE